ncbi:nuclear transport factor 2 family protein [Sphaerisporangium aureirubrum]|uniref:Nuclear transport factor 2 family protein n=1 Tax=Sphaerisporangium aureirubrum TaxID=1544736 RepID=A0ABW1NTN3_9ACTN
MSEAPQIATPRDIFNSLITGISTGAWADLADLYAEDVVVEMPFAIPAPVQIKGRDQIRAHFTAAAGRMIEIRPRDIVVHDTTDPEVIIAEFAYDGRFAGRQDFSVNNIQVLRVRDGLIQATRDYHDHFAMGVASGALSASPPPAA